MPDPAPSPAAPITLRGVALLSLLGGAVAGGATFVALSAVDPFARTTAASGDRTGAPGAAASIVADAEPEAWRSPDAAVPDAADVLDRALATAEAERSQLAGSLLELNRRAESLETRLAALATRQRDGRENGGEGGAGEEAGLPSGEPSDGIVAGEQGRGLGDSATGSGSPELDSLVAAGLDPASAADIGRRRDEFSLARLELIDRATREGWAESERFGESLEALERQRPDLREELGDEAYDRYLYERGGSNRIGIESVIAGSPAALAGLAPGDVVLSYAGSRVFGSRELQAATRDGERGEYVQLGVLRDGEALVIDVPRGPLGVTLGGIRREP